MDKGCLLTAGIMAGCCLGIGGLVFFKLAAPDEEKVGGPPREIAQISWAEMDAIYGMKSNAGKLQRDDASWPADNGRIEADLQKESSWPHYKGKVVEWEGELVEVKRKGLSLGIKMNPSPSPSTSTTDILLALRPAESAKARKLEKGHRLRFRGRLKSWGSRVQFSMDQGEILD